ncbi:MAG: hypothetical protein NVS3B20_20790 [Polyangiales bacterium]
MLHPRRGAMFFALILSFAPMVGSCRGSASPAAAPSSATANEEGSPATDFTLIDVDGNQVSLSTYLGKTTIVINFWATWCKPCAQEMPYLQRLYATRKDQGLIVFGISVDAPETSSQVAPFARDRGYTFPILLDDESRATALYNPQGKAPFTVIIDRHGKIASKPHDGFNPGDEVLLEAEVIAAMKY